MKSITHTNPLGTWGWLYPHQPKAIRGAKDSISIQHKDTIYHQSLYYEGIPFRCGRCHVYGHLAKDLCMRLGSVECGSENSQQMMRSKQRNLSSSPVSSPHNLMKHIGSQGESQPDVVQGQEATTDIPLNNNIR
jgi:hypothetical protein